MSTLVEVNKLHPLVENTNVQMHAQVLFVCNLIEMGDYFKSLDPIAKKRYGESIPNCERVDDQVSVVSSVFRGTHKQVKTASYTTLCSVLSINRQRYW